MSARERKTYNIWIQLGSIGALDDSMVEVIRVAFTLTLKLVEEVEDVKGEDC